MEDSFVSAVWIREKLFTGEIGPLPISRRKVAALDHDFPSGTAFHLFTFLIKQRNVRIFGRIPHRNRDFLKARFDVKKHSSQGAGLGRAKSDNQNGVGGKVLLVVFEFSMCNQVRSQLDYAETRKRRLSGDGVDQLSEDDGYRKIDSDFLLVEP